MQPRMLTDSERKALRAYHAEHKCSYAEAGRQFGVCRITAKNIIRRITKMDWETNSNRSPVGQVHSKKLDN